MLDREAIIQELEAEAAKLPEGSQEQLRVLMRIEDVRYYEYNLKDHAKAEVVIIQRSGACCI